MLVQDSPGISVGTCFAFPGTRPRRIIIITERGTLIWAYTGGRPRVRVVVEPAGFFLSVFCNQPPEKQLQRVPAAESDGMLSYLMCALPARQPFTGRCRRVRPLTTLTASEKFAGCHNRSRTASPPRHCYADHPPFLLVTLESEEPNTRNLLNCQKVGTPGDTAVSSSALLVARCNAGWSGLSRYSMVNQVSWCGTAETSWRLTSPTRTTAGASSLTPREVSTEQLEVARFFFVCSGCLTKLRARECWYGLWCRCR